MNSIEGEEERLGMNLGGGEDTGTEGETTTPNTDEEYDYGMGEEDDSWLPGTYLITKETGEKEESNEGEWTERSKKGRARPIMNVSQDKECECVDAVVDSGAVGTVRGPKTIPEAKRESTKASVLRSGRRTDPKFG